MSTYIFGVCEEKRMYTLANVYRSVSMPQKRALHVGLSVFFIYIYKIIVKNNTHNIIKTFNFH